MKTKEEILEKAELLGLQVIETCDNARGYPSGINKAIIGFNDFKDAQNFAIENTESKEVHLFKIRDGHHFYQNLGWKIRPLSAGDYVNDLGMNYRFFSDFDQEFEAAIDNLQYFKAGFDDYLTLIKRFETYKEIIDQLDDDSTLILNTNDNTLEEVKNELMGYSEDVYTYIIGVAL